MIVFRGRDYGSLDIPRDEILRADSQHPMEAEAGYKI